MYVVYDIETTGLSELNDDIIEFAYIAFNDDNSFIKSEQLFFYRKGMTWSEDAYRVHQIPLSFLETQADKFQENILKMYSILNHNNVVGYNNNHFDNPFVKTWLMRMGIRNLEYKVTQDIMVAYKPIYKKSRIKLTKLCEMQGLTPELINSYMPIWFPQIGTDSRAHEAAYDVVATALLTMVGISKKLVAFKSILAEEPELSNTDIADMMTPAMSEVSSMVEFTLEDTFGATETKLLKYNDPKLTERGATRVIIQEHLRTADDVHYALEHNGARVCYSTDDPDRLVLYTSGVSLDLMSMDIEVIVANNFR